MKKLMALLMASLMTAGLAACSEDTSKEADTEKDTSAAETETADQADGSKEQKSALLSYQSEVTKLIRSTEASFAEEGKDPAEAASAFEPGLDGIEIPEELSDYSADIEGASENLVQYFTKKGELLKAGSEDMAEAETFKEDYITGMTKVFEGVDISTPAFKGMFQ
ncbi:hypothetical protein [Bacillus infantis]|uniref:hypothetical protein n=1 Tax=Bacillus infantis TaxID=324767 RepID=UPI0021557318|nr:hypothetical protein [Bacillus infantis]MCR6610907.1 hypothetical protein [Bacillus infantis]